MLLTDVSDVQAKNEIARFLLEEINQGPSALVLLGPGSTVKSIADLLGVDKTLLGVDAIAGGGMVGKDLNERQLLDLLGRYPHRKLIVSPLGAQGFVLGRGNLQLSPAVIRLIGAENMIVVATPAKLTRTPVLRFDTGDAALDAALAGRGYVPVVTGYRQRRLVRVLV
jgi:predicted polyphosphate/ATP-dependent NAD kinase